MVMVKKSAEAFRTISEVSEILDIPAHVLRFWESRFTQIKPTKRGGGRRYYRPNDISLLRGIRDLLYSSGLTIKGVQKILREQGAKHVVALGHAGPVAENAPAKEETSPSVVPEQVVSEPAQKAKPGLRLVAKPDEQPEEVQVDLFAHADNRERRPFPPDPNKTNSREEIRTIISKLEKLRSRMVAT